jgi:hypothetical protein
MSRSQKNGVRLQDFVALFKSTMKTPAWRAMSHGARSLYVALKSRHNTKLQNAVYLSARVAAKELGSHKDYITRWHRELQHYSFTVIITPGHLGVEGKGKAAHLRLTECWYQGQPPTRDFERWDGTKFRYQKNRVPSSAKSPMSRKLQTLEQQKPAPKIGNTPARVPETLVPYEMAAVSVSQTPAVPQIGDTSSLTSALLKDVLVQIRRRQ